MVGSKLYTGNFSPTLYYLNTQNSLHDSSKYDSPDCGPVQVCLGWVVHEDSSHFLLHQTDSLKSCSRRCSLNHLHCQLSGLWIYEHHLCPKNNVNMQNDVH